MAESLCICIQKWGELSTHIGQRSWEASYRGYRKNISNKSESGLSRYLEGVIDSEIEYYQQGVLTFSTSEGSENYSDTIHGLAKVLMSKLPREFRYRVALWGYSIFDILPVCEGKIRSETKSLFQLLRDEQICLDSMGKWQSEHFVELIHMGDFSLVKKYLDRWFETAEVPLEVRGEWVLRFWEDYLKFRGYLET